MSPESGQFTLSHYSSGLSPPGNAHTVGERPGRCAGAASTRWLSRLFVLVWYLSLQPKNLAVSPLVESCQDNSALFLGHYGLPGRADMSDVCIYRPHIVLGVCGTSMRVLHAQRGPVVVSGGRGRLGACAAVAAAAGSCLLISGRGGGRGLGCLIKCVKPMTA